MIIGVPDEFAIFYETYVKSENGRWVYGFFNFVIDDILYPAKVSNFTLTMAIGELQENLPLFSKCEIFNTAGFQTEYDILKHIAHSQAKHLCTDHEDLILTRTTPIGIYLTQLEMADTGFYLFYNVESDTEESLIFSADYGLTAKKRIFPRGTVENVIKSLPDIMTL